MSQIYADATGKVIGLLSTAQVGQQAPPPEAVGNPLDFDPSTNPAVVTGILANPYSFRLVNGVLSQNGVTVTINASSQDYQTLSLIKQAITALKGTENLPSLATIQAAISAVQNGSATNVQAQLALAVLMRLVGLLAQRLLNNGTLG